MAGRHRRRRRRRWPLVAAGALTTVVLLLVGDLYLLSARLTHFPITVPQAAEPGVRTWLIIGSDSRADLADGTDSSGFGSVDQVPGRRADLIMLVRRSAGSTSVLSIPRDLVVQIDPGRRPRAALAVQDGYQGLVDGVCNTLGVPVTDMAVVDFRTFAAAVDAVGGVQVTIDAPVRDRYTGLDIAVAGRQHLDGLQALALVRSRHAEVLRDGHWVRAGDGATARADWGATVLREFAMRAADAVGNPLRAQRLAWVLTGGLQVSEGIGLVDLFELRSAIGAPQVLETTPNPDARILNRSLNDRGRRQLREMGYPGTCRSASMHGFIVDDDGRVRRDPSADSVAPTG